MMHPRGLLQFSALDRSFSKTIVKKIRSGEVDLESSLSPVKIRYSINVKLRLILQLHRSLDATPWRHGVTAGTAPVLLDIPGAARMRSSECQARKLRWIAPPPFRPPQLLTYQRALRYGKTGAIRGPHGWMCAAPGVATTPGCPGELRSRYIN